MTELVRSELLKVRTTRGWWIYLGLIVLLVGLGVSGDVGTAPDERLGEIDYQRGLVEGVGFAALLALILGITIVTTEFRHGTITPTLLNAPRRGQVIAAKAIAGALISLGFMLLALGVLWLVGSIWLAAQGAENRLAEGEVLELQAQVLLGGVIWGLMGIAVGALVQSQVAALVGTLIWIFLGETIVISVLGLLELEGAEDYLPFQALDAADGTNSDLLPYTAGLAVSLVWIVVIGAAGTERLRRRDIT